VVRVVQKVVKKVVKVMKVVMAAAMVMISPLVKERVVMAGAKVMCSLLLCSDYLGHQLLEVFQVRPPPPHPVARGIGVQSAHVFWR